VTKAQFEKMYMQLGLVAYIEFKIKKFEEENFFKPTLVHLGELEWKTILQSHPARDLKVGGVTCIPHLGEQQLVELE
jgi:hypothetical protein